MVRPAHLGEYQIYLVLSVNLPFGLDAPYNAGCLILPLPYKLLTEVLYVPKSRTVPTPPTPTASQNDSPSLDIWPIP